VYQDLFQEGSFIGKGIYDIDTFERMLGHRFPENRILSHDLLEGCYARAALISDIQLYESFPSRYSADAGRRHRWIRGDWQIARWLLPYVPKADEKTQSNPLSGISRWKIFDNLRRSVVPSAMVLLLILGWSLYRQPDYWTAIVAGAVLMPPLFSALSDLFRRSSDTPLERHLATIFSSLANDLAQAGCTLIFLPTTRTSASTRSFALWSVW
jgi:hypothetical protein